MNLATWAAWALTCIAFNCANSINSRSKQSASWRWNFYSTLVVSGLYVGSMLGIGNVILKAHSVVEIAVAVATYSLASAVGSVIGQEIVLQTKFFQRIERR